eukprot:430763_1
MLFPMVNSDTETAVDESDAFLGHSKLVSYRKTHENVLNKTKAASKAFIISSCFGYLYDSLLEGVWILYTRWLLNTYYSYYDVNTAISIFTLIYYIVAVIGAVLFSYLGDKYGFAKLLAFTSMIVCIGCALQCIYLNLVLFIIGFSLHGLVQDDIETFTLAFIGKYLPFETAAVYTGYFYAAGNIAYLFGFILAGTVTHLNTYRTAYFVALFIMFIRWLYILYFLRYKEKYLEQQHLEFIEYYKQIMSDSETNITKTLFPICLNKINSRNTCDEEKDSFFETSNLDHKSKWFWIELTVNIIQFSIFTNDYLQAVTFHAMYMTDRFHTITIISLFQIAIIAVCDGIIATLYKYMEAITIMNKYFILNVCYVMIIILLLFLFPYTNIDYAQLYWLYMIVYGIAIGISQGISEILVLELQPKMDSAKINGFKTFFHYLLSAVTMFFIAYFWSYGSNHVCYWYARSIVVAIGFCINILLCLRYFFCIGNQ